MSDVNGNEERRAFPTRRVNPRFSLDESVEGVETKGFEPGRGFVTKEPDASAGSDDTQFTVPRLASDESDEDASGVGRQVPEGADASPFVERKRVANSRFTLGDSSSDGITLEGGKGERGINGQQFAAESANVDAEDEVQRSRVASSRFNFKNPSEQKRRVDENAPWRSRPDELIEVGDEDAFQVKDKKPKPAQKRKRRFSITDRDVTLIRFLTRYQFSYVEALARLVDTTPQALASRLRVLESYDLVKRQRIAQGASLWTARKAGVELVGMNFSELKEIRLATIQHTVGLVNLAVELEREAGGKDILGLANFGEPFPTFNRFPGGLRVYSAEELDSVAWQRGEMTVSEREIRQGQKRWRGGRSTAEMRDLVNLAVESNEGIELEEGNEGLFVVYGNGGKTGEHVPDLVVQRPRRADGTPGHFAVELELTAKSPAEWKRILRSFRDAGNMYARVYYFTNKSSIANMIRHADAEVGLGSKLVIRKYIPRNQQQLFLG